MASQWYFYRGGERFGPVSTEQIQQLATSGELAPDDSLWRDGLDNPVAAKMFNGLFPTADANQTPPPARPGTAPSPPLPQTPLQRRVSSGAGAIARPGRASAGSRAAESHTRTGAGLAPTSTADSRRRAARPSGRRQGAGACGKEATQRRPKETSALGVERQDQRTGRRRTSGSRTVAAGSHGSRHRDPGAGHLPRRPSRSVAEGPRFALPNRR